eukprot:8704292-Heterocapsa_arctica.AAC.1
MHVVPMVIGIYDILFGSVARARVNPAQWTEVPFCPIDNGNSKPKCDGKRPVACLDPLARAFHKTFYSA